MDFEQITPCGENCAGCRRYRSEGACEGCRETEGRCVKMWENGCAIYACCLEHRVHFCGLCETFPCPWLTEKIGSWNPDGIRNLERLAELYRAQAVE